MDLQVLASLLGAIIVSVLSVGSGLVVARRFQKLGGGEAQERLNVIRKELDDAMDEKLGNLTEQFEGCKKRLIKVEATMRQQRERHAEAARRWVKERREFRGEILDLHAELKRLQPDRTARKDRVDD